MKTMVRLFFAFVTGIMALLCVAGCNHEDILNNNDPDNKEELIIDSGNQEKLINDSDNAAIEEFINLKNSDKTISFINDFLSSQSKKLKDEQKLQELTAWLKKNPDITDATILCVSCIYTLPAQSEISISFNVKDETIKLILDISMTEPLKALRFHEHY